MKDGAGSGDRATAGSAAARNAMTPRAGPPTNPRGGAPLREGVWLTAGSRGSRQLRNDTAVTTQSRNGLVVTSVVEMRSEDTNLKYIQGSSKEEREDIRHQFANPKSSGFACGGMLACRR